MQSRYEYTEMFLQYFQNNYAIQNFMWIALLCIILLHCYMKQSITRKNIMLFLSEKKNSCANLVQEQKGV